MHTKNIPGSHVIIKKYGEIPDTTLIQAASLAAYYSKAKESLKVPVDYTEVKNVHKPNGAKPGMVIYYTNKTLYVTLRNIHNSSILFFRYKVFCFYHFFFQTIFQIHHGK